MRSPKKAMRSQGNTSKNSVLKRIFFSQLIVIISLAVILGAAGTLINIHFETQKRDQNLQNIAETIAHSPILEDISVNNNVIEYLDSLKETLDSIDVISIVDLSSLTRVYHSSHELIGTPYDGTLPEFESKNSDFYVTSDTGPSGTQRRAYAAIYDSDGDYIGFVMAVILMKNIYTDTQQTLLIFTLITTAAILIELLVSLKLSKKIKKQLLGYEPNVFSAMYQIRDNILESLNEGIVAIDKDGILQFINKSALSMLGKQPSHTHIGRPFSLICDTKIFEKTLTKGEKDFNIHEQLIENKNILIDRIPIVREGEIIGAVGIFHDRAEYTKLMEDLTGTQYLVDSMRANNHDFTNKLHVILGLIQMEMYNEAIEYIENISIVQRTTVSKIMNAVDEPAIAALLIGKIARASELNTKFVLREGSSYMRTDISIPTGSLVTVIGNLIDNAFEAMDEETQKDRPKELIFGIYSKPGALLLTADDTGYGIKSTDLGHIFENGFSTKGKGRGTGLYQLKKIVDSFNGKISVESQPNIGTSFSISFIDNKKKGK